MLLNSICTEMPDEVEASGAPATERVLPKIEHTIGPLRRAILGHLLDYVRWTAERRAASRRDARSRTQPGLHRETLHARDIPTAGRDLRPSGLRTGTAFPL